MDKDELLTTKQAAKIMGFSQQYINRLIKMGRLKAQKVGRFYIIRRGDLDTIEPAERRVGRPRKDDG